MEYSAGCIAFKLVENRPLFGMILDRFNRWCFSKGHLEGEESAFEAARRELEEEVGLSDVELVTRLGDMDYTFTKGDTHIEKHVEWFLVKATSNAELHRSDPDHVFETAWLEYEEADRRLGYKELKPLLKLAEEVVKGCYVVKES
jgi:8-oxo-dGTP pyrophosphatase MutT (NUDIX family)